MALVQVTGTPFVRDTDSMVLSNVDSVAREEYYNKVRILTNQKEQLNKVNEEINQLKDDVSEIKSLLKQLINTNNQ